MDLIPKLSEPLAKDIRTGEGVLEWLLALLFGILALLPHGLTWTQSGTFLSILAGLKAFRRLFIKVVAVQNDVGIGPPIPFGDGPALDGGDAAADATNDAIAAASSTATPSDRLTAAGAPGDAPPGASPSPAPAAPGQ